MCRKPSRLLSGHRNRYAIRPCYKHLLVSLQADLPEAHLLLPVQSLEPEKRFACWPCRQLLGASGDPLLKRMMRTDSPAGCLTRTLPSRLKSLCCQHSYFLSLQAAGQTTGSLPPTAEDEDEFTDGLLFSEFGLEVEIA